MTRLVLNALALILAGSASAAAPTGLRGTTAPAAPVTVGSATDSATSPATDPAARAFLGAAVWRAGACDPSGNFQSFVFSPAASVEVGSGAPGQGERLELLRAARGGSQIEVETRVCAPVGCNRTVERYKVLDPNRIQEWHFEGRLPDQPPYVLVANGIATDGSGPGRVFHRCTR
jgi:hypothetical protein